jgi:DNA gyrase subunit A
LNIQDEINSNVIDVDIEKEMQKSFLDYSMSVIVSRALPDVRDGLKPVHRRILYSQFEDNLYPEKPYKKCATTVGNVLGRWLGIRCSCKAGTRLFYEIYTCRWPW